MGKPKKTPDSPPMTAQSLTRPPLGTVHRSTLEAFRQGDPEYAEYLEKHGRIVIVE